ncbi:retrotransposon protein, putative, Ty3-gypsy subclass [Panicum miliaceum]|uniref:Retrotransposon protein, putative, Ty3-gypsy subclass n=1 Tax=Panicum miliaceum TaxID=4540 RepID=A0A3L6RMV7_PANMI|nr:retrotransposon protein, putative, Ty3-gypsy subclass [Panicum miliaceum]
MEWCPANTESFPSKNMEEVVLFFHFVERGLALPSCDFFRGLLYSYGLQVHHLNPNSIIQAAIFVHFCGAFLGSFLLPFPSETSTLQRQHKCSRRTQIPVEAEHGTELHRVQAPE